MVAVLQPMKQGRIIAVDRAVILVGRSSDCDAVINGSQKISRRHCCLVQVDDTYYVRDLGSMNGVWLNGKKVNREALLSSGDCVSIGDVEFLFHPNARIEQKKTITHKEYVPIMQDNGLDDLTAEIVQVDESIDVIDDVIPLDQIEVLEDFEDSLIGVDDLLVETNEVEVIDQPIVDDDDPNDDLEDVEDIIVFDD